ncbi:ACT domain-containing protein [Lacticaseibacillus nasuensis]|uniref:ACT domain-containing protein n=1 Tax=Lacticaseibacillus nasuensis TaxID=944671 RepID=UPI0022486CE3|nr:ACT domain-containing protein [Lacticaseibacillus nasuensis]MCX2455401.1 ACT domain-containing protein [Lacticaseibacillus nasuensis]
MEKYYIVDSSILPDVVDKVIEARTLIENGQVRQVSEAVRQVGISRGTYYKYKDYVFLPDAGLTSRKAVISLMLHHDRGILSEVLATVSNAEASILTINQNIPIHDWASVVISFDISNLAGTLDDLLAKLRQAHGVTDVALISVE